jgi:hypothetical protein
MILNRSKAMKAGEIKNKKASLALFVVGARHQVMEFVSSCGFIDL